jgi:hypothetical protein
LTVHRVRYPRPRNSRTDGAPVGPKGAAAWRFGPDAPLGDDGFRTGQSDVWGGVGFYETRDQAEEVLSNPSAHLGFLNETDEAWHALAAVVAHRGEVDWSTDTEPHPGLEALAQDPGGVMAVITSAGYDSAETATPERVRDFLKRVDQVIEWYGSLEANIARCLFNAVTARQGMTFSVWKSDRDMIATAYKGGTHSDYIKRNQETPMFDHSSFTRLRLLNSRGSWDGIDPREAAVQAV